MKEIAIVGFAPTKELARDLPESVPIWSLNNAFLKGLPRIDVLFDPHYLEHISHPAYTRGDRIDHRRLEWLRENTTIPVYMIRHYDEIPMSRPYPIEEIVRWKGDKNNLSSTYALMMAFALHKDPPDRIYIYGFHMGAEYEYIHQLPDGLYWKGRAEGMGVEVIGPEESNIFRQRKVYGFEGTAMITRRTLEKHRDIYQQQQMANNDNLAAWKGKLQERMKGYVNPKTGNLMGNHTAIQEAQQMVRRFEAQRFASECVVASLQRLIDVADMIEVEPVEINIQEILRAEPSGGEENET